jgi:hypothetical protein
MNARDFRVKIDPSALDFPPIMGMGESTITYKTEPPRLVNNKLWLSITNYYILIETFANKKHEIFSVESIYEIPTNQIKSREDVYEFYKDAIQGLSEAYQFVRTKIPTLHNISFPNPQIENLQREIDGVFYLLQSQN